MGDKIEKSGSTLWQLPKDVCCSYDMNFYINGNEVLGRNQELH
jgi:hypothetical protein